MMHKKLLHIVVVGLVLAGAINWGTVGLLKLNVVEAILGPLSVIVYIAVGVAAVYLAARRDTFLPFLGHAVIPSHLLKPSVPDKANGEIKVHVHPHAKVMYWAAEPSPKNCKTLQDPWKAYGKGENSGVAIADNKGVATLKVRKPQPYRAYHKTLAPHIHYRVTTEKHPNMLSPVKTAYFC